ncbi:NAD-dependent epimerase/dehydratase family protein [Luethyella okanaganae]|uniref:NAD-dependent epimerase/dehydratase family protein n=1 Tax=Luethyella okanaganae TaxID=69372 RepID=A0ABW1VC25_9MICO
MTGSTWSVVGGSGFIGRSIVAELEKRHKAYSALSAPRLDVPRRSLKGDALRVASRDDVKRLTSQLAGTDVVVNAAGLARPGSAASGALYGANAFLPLVVAEAAQQAGVRRIIHLSSAAVQGRAASLDETMRLAPFSPYSESKAMGERLLMDWSGSHDAGERASLVIVRATSVQGHTRDTTDRLARLARSGFSSVASPGTQRTVVSSLQGLVDFVIAVGEAPGPVPGVVLQPWEGTTVSSVLRDAGNREPKVLPRRLCGVAVCLGYAATAVLGRRHAGAVRRVELMWFGQEQDASWARSIRLEREFISSDSSRGAP